MRVWLVALAATALLTNVALAQTAPVAELPEVEVTGASPLLGSGFNRDEVPGTTSVLTKGQIQRTGIPQAVRALQDNVPGVSLSDAAGNPNQPNLFYHGFAASPLQGTPQGLAVYLNGVRFNQAFGDTVQWDLIPDIAIDQMDLVGANPVFGLNALGGALSVQMKNGFTYQGAEVTGYGGSFGQVGTNFQYGRKTGEFSTYVAGAIQHQSGWRDLQSSDLYQIYGDIGWRGAKGELHLNIIGADTQLNGPGTSPVQLLSVNPAAQFTAPNLVATKYTLLSLNGNWDVSDTTSLQGVVYYDYLQQRVFNGNVTEFAPCADDPALLCNQTGSFATAQGGNPIPSFLGSGPYSQLDQQATNTNGYGISLQATNRDTLFGHANQLVVGASFDGAQTAFSAASSIGGLSLASREFLGPGVIIDQADGSIAPVRVGIGSAYYGLFFTDIFSLTPTIALNVAGRFNSAQIGLNDHAPGGPLSGQHAYNRFNPAVGITWKLLPWLTTYASYSESNRAPTPQELSCASAESPCSLANFFVGDPNLKQVVAHTVEFGFRGRAVPSEGIRLDWNFGLYNASLSDDILFVNSPVEGRGFFANVGSTRRRGVDVGIRLTTERLTAWVNFAYVDATFQSPFIETSENNPAANEDGTIAVRRGNRLPGIPPYQGKLGVEYRVTDDWSIGANAIVASSQFLFGDEANLTPKLPAYFVLNLTTRYQLTEAIQVFATMQNVTNAKYYTFGTFSPTALVPIAQVPGATNPRSYSPAAPVGAFGGVRVVF